MSEPAVLGEVHVVVHELLPGQSEVSVSGRVDEIALIDAAIAELQVAGRVFHNEEFDRPSR